MKEKINHTLPALDDSIQVVTFQVGSEEYALDIGTITEVIRPLRITPLPKMPVFIEGVVNLRGVIIPVVDLRTRFELRSIKNDPRRMRMIITRGAVPGNGGSAGLLGLVVDGVEEVINLPKKEIDPAPPAATGRNAEFITGMGKMGNRLIVLIDVARILNSQERTALVEAGRA